MRAIIINELRKQGAISVPLVVMNLASFAKISLTTVFLGFLGELELAGGTLGFCFANVTGLSVLTGLAGAMEPICGQAHGAKNRHLLHKTLMKGIILLLSSSLPITFLWLKTDKILLLVGQKKEISKVARAYVAYLLPDLAVTAFLVPLKTYLSSQGITLPILFSSLGALAFHVPVSFLLFKSWGLRGIATAFWLTDLFMALILIIYILGKEKILKKREKQDQKKFFPMKEWILLLRLAGPCCLTTCLEWWCYEILILVAGNLPDSQRNISILAVVFNFDYLLYAVMISLATCASARVSNELGAGSLASSRFSALVCLSVSSVVGFLAAVTMALSGRWWPSLFSRDEGVREGGKKMMMVMALVDLVNFPLTVCGGIVRGTARPWLGVYANVLGFYLVALPVGVGLAIRARLGLEGLLLGTLAGVAVTAGLLMMLVLRTDWEEEIRKAKELVGSEGVGGVEGMGPELAEGRKLEIGV